jgi:hypothetical protein
MNTTCFPFKKREILDHLQPLRSNQDSNLGPSAPEADVLSTALLEPRCKGLTQK